MCSVKPVSRRSIGRVVLKMNLKKGKAEQTTDARAIATADKLNSVSIAAAHYLMVPLSTPYLMINADGTSYSTGGGLTDGVEVYYLADEQKGATLKVPAQRESTHSLLCQILPVYDSSRSCRCPDLHMCG